MKKIIINWKQRRATNKLLNSLSETTMQKTMPAGKANIIKRVKVATAALLALVMLVGVLPQTIMAYTSNNDAAYTTYIYDAVSIESDEVYEDSNVSIGSDEAHSTDEAQVPNDETHSSDDANQSTGSGDAHDYDAHADTNTNDELDDEAYIETYYEEIMPLIDGFSATITHGANTVAFGPGSQIRIPNGPATTVGQVMRIADVFPAGTTTPAVVFHIEQGMMLGSGVPGFTGTGHNRVFNINNLPDHLEGVVTYARWIPADRLEFDITGDWHQPMGGILVYLLAPGTHEVDISVQVAAERVFSQTGDVLPNATPPANRIHANALRGQTFANIGLSQAQLQALTAPTPHEAITTYLAGMTTLNEASLEEYGLVGSLTSRLQPVAPTVSQQVRVFSQGASWETHVDSRAYAVNYPRTRTMAEEIVIVLHLDRNLGVQGVRSRPGSQITDGNIVNPSDVFPTHPNLANLEPMFTYTIDRTSHATSDIVTITFTQPRLIEGEGIFVIYGTIPTDATPGSYGSLGLQSAQSHITPLSGGTVSNMGSWGFEAIHIIESGTGSSLSIHPLNDNPQHSNVPTDGALDWLGGFLLRNESGAVSDQAVRVFFDDDNIGVQAFRLPVGPDGLGNLYVYTTDGRRIYATDPGVLLTSHFNSGGLATGNNQHVVQVNFLGALNPGEYIAELYYELPGVIPQGWWHGGQQVTTPGGTNFMVLGQIRAPRDEAGNFESGSFSYRAIVGEIDNTSPTGISPNYAEATTIRHIVGDARALYSSIPGNLSDQLIAGGDFVRRNVGFSLPMNSGWRSGNVIPMAVQGHYVYLRAPNGVLEIERGTLAVTWMNQTFTESNGMTVTEIIDSTNATVFRLALPDITMGIFNEDFAINAHGGTGQTYTGMTVHFDVRALPQAATQSFPMNQVAMIVPMNSDIIPQGADGNRQATNVRDFTIDDGVNPVRVGPGVMVSGNSAYAVNIQENAELQTWVIARSVDDTGALLASSSGHEWDTRLGWLNLVPGGGIEKEFHYFNNTDAPVGQFHVFIPIPKAGEMMPLTQIPEVDLRAQVQREPFEFSLYLLDEIATIPGFIITYSLTYSFDVNFAGFLPWGDIAAADRAEIRMVRIVSYRDIAPGEQGYFLLELGHGEETIPYAGMENRYAPLTFSQILGNAAQRRSHAIAMRMWNYVIFHYNYDRDDDGIFDTEPVQNMGTVSAPMPVPTRAGYTFIRWTTDTENTIEYDFSLPVNQPILDLFAEWRTNNYVSYYVAAGDGIPATFTPSPIPEPTNEHPTGTTGISIIADLTTTETTRTIIVNDESVTELGTWTFNGWTAPTGLEVTGGGTNTVGGGTFTMPGNDVEFTGYWTFAPNPRFDVTYTVTGNEPATFAPAVPVASSHQEGETGISVAPTLTTTETTRVVGSVTEWGTWAFSGWTAPAGLTVTGGTFTMPGSDVEFTGVWTFIPNQIFEVTYNVTSEEPATFNPSVPSASPHQEGETGIAVAPTLTTTETTRIVGGVTEWGAWAFSGWTAPAGLTVTGGTFTMPGGDVEFTGVWTFTPNQIFEVTYNVTSEEPATFAPAVPVASPHQEGETGIAVAPTLTTTETTRIVGGVTEWGAWTFSGWTTPAGLTVTGGTFTMPGSDVEFTGVWTFIPNQIFEVTYNVTSEEPATFNPSVPVASSHQEGETGISVAPPLTTTETTRVVGGVTEWGVWTFNNWTTQDVGITGGAFTMPGNDVEFTGSWTFTPHGSFTVTYNVTSDEPVTFNPSVPSASPHQEGETGISVAPTLTTTETTRVVGGVTEWGTWAFSGWTAPAGLTVTGGTFTMPGSDVEFTGAWTFTPNQMFEVTYTVTGEEPATFNPTVPTVSLHQEGETGISVAPPLITTETTRVVGGVTEWGTWAFSGWTAPAGLTVTGGTFTMPGGDVEFTGSWTFTPNQIFEVTYNVTSEEPATFNPSIPVASSHQEGETGIAVAPPLTTAETTRVVGGVTEWGVWTFIGWTPPVGLEISGDSATPMGGSIFTMPGSDVEFTGEWMFTPNPMFEVTYTVTGEEPATFDPAVPSASQHQQGETGIVVAPPLTTAETTRVVDGVTEWGVWTFNNWTTQNVGITDGMFTMPGNDVEFMGSWTFTPHGSFTVTYIVTGDEPATFNPSVPVASSHQEGETGIAVALALTTTETTRVTGGVTEQGVWTFTGWTAPSNITVVGGTFTMPGSDVEFTGYWTFTPDPQRVIRIYYYLEDGDSLVRDTENNPLGRQYYELIGSTFDLSHVLDRNELTGDNEYVFEGWLVHIGATPNQSYLSDLDTDELHDYFVVPTPITGFALSLDEVADFNALSSSVVGETIILTAVWSLYETEKEDDGGGNQQSNLPQTGIESNTVLWSVLLALTILVAKGMIILIKRSKKSSTKD